MIRLFACDLDGTLLNERHESDAFIEGVLRSVVESGRYFTVATGRSTSMIDFGEMNGRIYVICMNGSLILDPKGRVVRCEKIDKEVLLQLLEQFPTLRMECLSAQHSYIRQDKETFVAAMMANKDRMANGERWVRRLLEHVDEQMCFSQRTEEILKQDICKINCRVDTQEEARQLQEYLQVHADALVNAPSNQGHFEITASGVNKGTAILHLADRLGIDAQDVAVYGDGGNDLEMLTMFAHSYAPCTAQKEAQMAASAIIGPYQSYSVAKHIAETLVKEDE